MKKKNERIDWIEFMIARLCEDIGKKTIIRGRAYSPQTIGELSVFRPDHQETLWERLEELERRVDQLTNTKEK